jgi:hypothetical protein
MGVRHPSYDYTSAESLSPRFIHVVQYQLYSSSAGISRLLYSFLDLLWAITIRRCRLGSFALAIVS